MVSRNILEQQGSNDVWGDYLPQANPLSAQNNSQTSKIKTCWLNQFSALKIYGPDAERFLQGQLTCNLTDINIDTVHYGACCNPKGRIVANFNISFDGENYWLVLPTKSAEVLDKHLQKYKVFFKATIENCQQSHLVLGQWTDTKVSTNPNDQQLIISASRQLLITEDNSLENHALEDQSVNLVPTLDWRLDDISDGIFFIDNDQHEQWIPQHINWHKLDGISFNKGCYTGQEIVARLQYLGKVKKALYHYQIDSNNESAFIQIGTQLFDSQGKSQGDIVMQRNSQILAVLNGENPDVNLYLTDSDEFPLTLQNLPYTDKKEK